MHYSALLSTHNALIILQAKVVDMFIARIKSNASIELSNRYYICAIGLFDYPNTSRMELVWKSNFSNLLI